MNIDQIRQQFADEDTCRYFFESILWKDGRICPHGYCEIVMPPERCPRKKRRLRMQPL